MTYTILKYTIQHSQQLSLPDAFCPKQCFESYLGRFYNVLQYGSPKGIRIPVLAVKGRCPRPLDDGTILFLTVLKSVSTTTLSFVAKC